MKKNELLTKLNNNTLKTENISLSFGDVTIRELSGWDYMQSISDEDKTSQILRVIMASTFDEDGVLVFDDLMTIKNLNSTDYSKLSLAVMTINGWVKGDRNRKNLKKIH